MKRCCLSLLPATTPTPTKLPIPLKKSPHLPFLKHEDLHFETQYFFENGYRKVRPYVFEIKSHAKARWFNRRLLEVFLAEFPAITSSYYSQAILEGRVTVNSQRATLDTLIREGDILGHVVVRHEPPVLDDKVEVIMETPDHVAVNKPGSMPVHPTGRYRHNTLTTILRREHGIKELFPIHRLDTMTSGLVIFGKTSAVSRHFQELMKQKGVKKEYICRVKGVFPAEDVECTEPLDTDSLKLGITLASPDGKSASTQFRRISTDGKTSLVQCTPLTGRTHQIRVHLQFLGFPIVNDPLYAHPAFGPALGKGGLTIPEKQQLVERLTLLRPKANEALINPLNHKTGETPAKAATVPPEGDAQMRRHQLCLWLHARRYSGRGFDFSTPLPSWANPDFSGDKMLTHLLPTDDTLPWPLDSLMLIK